MKPSKTCLALCAVLTAASLVARPPEPVRQADVSMASRSIRLGNATGATNNSVVFSTPGAGARFFGNGEWRPSTARPGFYESAYVIMDDDGDARVEAGTIFIPIPGDDANGDTLPDTADPTAAVDVTLIGDVVPNGASLAHRISKTSVGLHLQRAASSDIGSYSLDLIDGVALGGDYSVLHAEGTVDYQRTDTGALLNFDLSNGLTNTTTTSRLIDSDTLRVAAFRLRVSTNRTVRVGPATLARDNGVYRGETQLSDGLTETTVPDFRAWLIQITDANDSNTNGVPDLSDTLAPYIAADPVRQIVPLGGNVTLSVVVSGVGPFTYEWQQNGHDISNAGADASQRVLVIPNATLADKGSYRVRVTNAAGSVWSDSTSVSFQP